MLKATRAVLVASSNVALKPLKASYIGVDRLAALMEEITAEHAEKRKEEIQESRIKPQDKPPKLLHHMESRGNFDNCMGKSGVVYILVNQSFKEGWFKIGCSTRSGHERARRINEETTALTGLPAELKCIFEARTKDCGTAERRVHRRLRHYRRGKHGTKRDGNPWGQEWFFVDFNKAKEVVRVECDAVNGERDTTFGETLLPDEAVPQNRELDALQAETQSRIDAEKEAALLAGLVKQEKEARERAEKEKRAILQEKEDVQEELKKVEVQLSAKEQDWTYAEKTLETLQKDRSALLHAKEMLQQQLQDSETTHKAYIEKVQQEHRTALAQLKEETHSLLSQQDEELARKGELAEQAGEARRREETLRLLQEETHQRQIAAEAEVTISQLSQVIEQAQVRRETALAQLARLDEIKGERIAQLNKEIKNFNNEEDNEIKENLLPKSGAVQAKEVTVQARPTQARPSYKTRKPQPRGLSLVDKTCMALVALLALFFVWRVVKLVV